MRARGEHQSTGRRLQHINHSAQRFVLLTLYFHGTSGNVLLIAWPRCPVTVTLFDLSARIFMIKIAFLILGPSCVMTMIFIHMCEVIDMV